MFRYQAAVQDNVIKVTLSGRFSGENEDTLQKTVKDLIQPNIKEVRFFTQGGFLITRSGIESLMTIIRSLRQTEQRVVLENLPYNYARVFQMAEMDKIADLVEEVLPE